MNGAKIITFGFLLSICCYSFGQEEKQVIQEGVETIRSKTPQESAFEKLLLEKAWYLADFPIAKASEVSHRCGNIKMFNLENIDIHGYNLTLKQDDYQYFRINSGSKMLVLRSKDHTLKRMQKNGQENGE